MKYSESNCCKTAVHNTSHFSAMPQIYSESDIKIMKNFLKNNIENNLNNVQKFEVKKIIFKDNNNFSKNSNGYWIYLDLLSDNTIVELYNFTKYCLDSKIIINENEEKMKIEKKIINDVDVDEKSFHEIIENNNFEKNPIFDEFTINSYIIPEFKELIDNYKLSDIDGQKIILKKNKVKFIGIKSKILKRYKDISKNSIMGSNKIINSTEGEIVVEEEE
jgi:hypothetical protein